MVSRDSHLLLSAARRTKRFARTLLTRRRRKPTSASGSKPPRRRTPRSFPSPRGAVASRRRRLPSTRRRSKRPPNALRFATSSRETGGRLALRSCRPPGRNVLSSRYLCRFLFSPLDRDSHPLVGSLETDAFAIHRHMARRIYIYADYCTVRIKLVGTSGSIACGDVSFRFVFPVLPGALSSPPPSSLRNSPPPRSVPDGTASEAQPDSCVIGHGPIRTRRERCELECGVAPLCSHLDLQSGRRPACSCRQVDRQCKLDRPPETRLPPREKTPRLDRYVVLLLAALLRERFHPA